MNMKCRYQIIISECANYEHFENWENKKKTFSMMFHFWISQNQNKYKRTIVDEYAYKNSSRYLITWLSFAILNANLATFYAI